jgi:hypothetical protein
MLGKIRHIPIENWQDSAIYIPAIFLKILNTDNMVLRQGFKRNLSRKLSYVAFSI